jgi:hypothetical protein
MTHMTSALAVRGWRRPNHPTVCTVIWNRSVLGLNARFGACSWFMHTEVRFGEPVPAKWKEENGGGLTSSFFGRLCSEHIGTGFRVF